MTKSQMENLAQKKLNAYNKRDLETFCACFHPQVKVYSLISNHSGPNGIEEFKKSYKAMFEASPQLHCLLKSRIVNETAVIDEEWVTGSARYPDGIHSVIIYGFRDGLIDRIWSCH